MSKSYFAFDCCLFQSVNKLILFTLLFLKESIMSQIFKTAQNLSLSVDR